MSSLKLEYCSDVIETEAPAAWVQVVSPLRERPMPRAAGVVLALSDLRVRYRGGEQGEVTVDTNAEYGSGDAEFADDIAHSLDTDWDN